MVSDEVAVPGNGRKDGDGDQEQDLVDVELGAERKVEEGEDDSRRDGVDEVPVA